MDETENENGNGKLQLDDFLTIYPPITKDNFQTYITAKKEFSELASAVYESRPKIGSFYKHQQLILRYMRAYDQILLFHKTGTGKSCAITAVTEYFKRVKLGLEGDAATNIRKVYILVKGESLIKEFTKQIVCRCTAGEYLTENVIKSKTLNARKNNLTRSLGKWYKIVPYGVFINKIMGKEREKRPGTQKGPMIINPEKRLTDAEILRKYSNCIFVVDEVHNLRNDPASGENSEEITSFYQEYWRLFHGIVGSKIILASATPMINSVNDIVRVMNLILPVDKQLDINKDYTNATLDDMKSYFQGRVSYVRELDTGAVPVFQCNVELEKKGYSCELNLPIEINKKEYITQTSVYKSIMSDFQQEAYEKTVQDSSGFSVEPRQTSNFVFPDGSFGDKDKGFRNYAKHVQGDVYQFTDEMKKRLKTLADLAQFSSKFATIVDTVRKTEGSGFCYSEFVTSGSILLGLCFGQFGFEQFTEDSSVFEISEGRLPPYCSSVEVIKKIKPKFKKAPRYALLTADSNFDVVLELFNSEENINGEYIKVLIGSPVARDGINLANVLQIHIVEPSWHRSGTYQATSRAIRTGSHDTLVQLARDEYKRNKKPEELAKVEIKVFYHASIVRDRKEITHDLKWYRESERKDIEIKHMERIMKQCSFDCQIHYQRNVRPRDVDGSAVCDYMECRYKCVDPTPRELNIFPKSNHLDYSTYDILYGEDVKRSVIEDVKELFQQNFVLTRSDITQYLKGLRPQIVDIALAEAAKDRFIDRYGISTQFYISDDLYYVSEKNKDTWYYDQNLSGIESYNLLEYIAESKREKEEATIRQVLSESDITIDRLKEILNSLTIARAVQLLETAALIVYGGKEKVRNTVAEKMIQFFKKHDIFYTFREPEAKLEDAKKELLQRALGKTETEKMKRGKRLNLDLQQKARKVKLPSTTEKLDVGMETELDLGGKEEEEEKERGGMESSEGIQSESDIEKEKGKGEIVFVHTLYDLENISSYNRKSRITKPGEHLRILKLSENIGWRDTNQYEYPIYNEMIQVMRLNKVKELTRTSKIFGIIEEKYDVFSIADTRKGEEKISKKGKKKKEQKKKRKGDDARFFGRGFICKNALAIDIIDVLWELTERNRSMGKGMIDLPDDIEKRPLPSGKEGEEAMIDLLIRTKKLLTAKELKSFSRDKLEYYYMWLREGVSREEMCSIIREYLVANNLIYEVPL